jgi:hypothetical protein
MTLINYAYHANPTSHHDVLTKLKTFAEAQGWTSDYYYSNSYYWGATGSSPPYGFMAGPPNESHLGLSSNGYGYSDMIIRFQCNATGSDPQNETFYCAGIIPGTAKTPDGNSSSDPYTQSEFTHTRYAVNSMSPGTMSAVWFFGSKRQILIVLAIDSSFCTFTFFGMPDLFKTTDGGFITASGGSYHDAYVYWYDAWTQTNEWDFAAEKTGSASYPNSYDVNDGSTHAVWRPNVFVNATGTGHFNNVYEAIQQNAWTGKRTMVQPTVFVERKSDSVWYPVGTWPWFYTSFSGLAMGDTLTYGAEEYIVFPENFNTRDNGIAFRIT